MGSIAGLLGLIIPAVPTGPVGYAAIAGPFDVTVTLDVPYVSDQAPASARAADRLDSCVPQGGPWSPPFPGVLIVHGGSWSSGSRDGVSGNLELCRHWASWGFSAVTIDYRLFANNDPTTFWPACLFDVQAAVRWMRAHAAALRMNPAQILASGDSAGGQLVEYLAVEPATIAIIGQDHDDEVTRENSEESPQVQAAIAELGPTTVRFGQVMHSIDPTRPMLFSHTEDGHVPSGSSLLAAQTRLQQSDAPIAEMMFVQGDDDRTVPPRESQFLYELLGGHGRPRHYYRYAGGHEFAGAGVAYWTIRQAEIAFAMHHFRAAGALPANAAGPPVRFDNLPPGLR